MLLSDLDKENASNSLPQQHKNLSQSAKKQAAPVNHASKGKPLKSFGVGKLSLSKPGSSSSSSSNKLAASMPLLAEKKGAGAAAHPPASTRKPLSSSTVNAGAAAKKGQQPQKGDHDEDRKKASAFAKPPPGSIKTLSLAKPVAAKPQKLPSEGVMPPVHCLFDDQWREKQEACFSEWINFMFAEEVSAAEAEAAESTYRALERRRHDDRVRWRVASVWESPEVRQIMYKVDKEVKLERLVMRMDRMVHTDVGLRDLLLQILLGINTASLRPALEVIYNQAIPRTHASDSVNLHRFVTSRLTKNPDILSKFAINGSSSELNTSPGFYKELNSFILLKFLQVILLLDRSKIGGALEGCLFNKAASVPGPHGTIKLLPIRSTKDALVRFSKEFLSGEGDVIRHLSLLGMSITFQQTPLDEFDMTVTALASDLRDGVRLAQLVDRVAPPCSGNEIRQKLRVPAISRLQKVHNVNLALDRFKNLGLIQGSDKDLARDVVDGHREQTLGLLWLLMSNYQLPSVIAPSTLKEEIARILLGKRRAQRSGRRPGQAGGDANPGCEANGCSNEPLSGDIVELLLRWCQSVCSPLGAQVHNFTTSFADGRVLCTLIHAYIPGMLPIAAIQPTRCDVVGSTAQGAADADIAERHGTWAYCMMDRSSPGYAAALAGEKENLKMAMTCAQQVGGVPGVLRAQDMMGAVPEEKTVITFVAHLAARLIDLGVDGRAAGVVQRSWRITRRVRQVRQYEGVILTVQRYSRGFLARRRCAAMRRASVSVQAWWRRCRAVWSYASSKRSAVIIQSAWRMHAAIGKASSIRVTRDILQAGLAKARARRDVVLARHDAATVIRATWLGTRQRREDALRARSAVKMQSTFRMHSAVSRATAERTVKQLLEEGAAKSKARRDRVMARHGASTVIRAAWLGHCSYTKHEAMKKSAVILQRIYRGFAQARVFASTRAMAMAAQKIGRGFLARAEARDRVHAIIKIQAAAKGLIVCKRYAAMRSAAVRIQAMWRCSSEMSSYRRGRSAVIALQSMQRGAAARLLARRIRSAVLIQKIYRGSCQAKTYARQRRSAARLQRYSRGFLARRRCAAMRRASVSVQAWWRRCRAVWSYASSKRSAVIIQSAWRMHAAIGKASHEKTVRVLLEQVQLASTSRCLTIKLRHSASTLIRAAWLGNRQRAQFARISAAILTIQSLFRGSAARAEFTRIRSAVVIQSVARMRTKRTRFLASKAAACIIQRLARGAMVRARIKIDAKAALRVQSWWRCIQSVASYSADRRDIITVQSVFRRATAVRRYAASRTLAAAAQRIARGFLSRRAARAGRAATMIKKVWKGHRQKRAYARERSSAVRIQSAVRMYAATREYRQEMGRVIAIQAWARGNASRARVPRVRGEMQEQRSRVVRARSALMIQSFWRGYTGRKALWANCTKLAKKAKDLRARIEEARRTVQEHMKLGNRTQAGLDVLLHSSSITTIIKAAVSLEVTTRLSEACARCVADLGAIEKLYGVVASCNRSKPEMELARHCLVTLTNFMQYPDMKGELRVMPLCADTLTSFIARNRDKDEAAVLMACKLLSYLCKDAETAREVAAIQGSGGNPSPCDNLRVTIKALQRKAPAAGAPGKKAGKSVVCSLESLLKLIERT